MLDRTGHRYNMLTVIRWHHVDEHRAHHWICRCDCGTYRLLTTSNLVHNNKGCGCVRGNPTHGGTRDYRWAPGYSIWSSMIQRCCNQKSPRYKDYGGRGISVCERWRADFGAFAEDMGPRPSKEHSLDRINNDGNYEPGNCRWATRVEQARNKRNTRSKP